MTKEPSYEFVSAEPLLVPVMKAGRPIHTEDIHTMRARCREQVASLPAELKKIDRTEKHEALYDVRPSAQLNKLLDSLKTEMTSS